jgi:hypothetical protein
MVLDFGMALSEYPLFQSSSLHSDYPLNFNANSFRGLEQQNQAVGGLENLSPACENLKFAVECGKNFAIFGGIVRIG